MIQRRLAVQKAPAPAAAPIAAGVLAAALVWPFVPVHGLTVTGASVHIEGPGERLLVLPEDPEPYPTYSYTAVTSFTDENNEEHEAGDDGVTETYDWTVTGADVKEGGGKSDSYVVIAFHPGQDADAVVEVTYTVESNDDGSKASAQAAKRVVVPKWEIATPIAGGTAPDIRTADSDPLVQGRAFVVNSIIPLIIDEVEDMDRRIGEKVTEETRPLTESACYRWSVTGVPGAFVDGRHKGAAVKWIPEQPGTGGVFHCTIDDDDKPEFTAYIDIDPHLKGTRDDPPLHVASPGFVVIRARIISAGIDGVAGLPAEQGVPIAYRIEPPGVSGHGLLEARDANGTVVGAYSADQSGGDHTWTWTPVDQYGNPLPPGTYGLTLKWTVPWGGDRSTTATDSASLTLVKLDLVGHWPGKPGAPGPAVSEEEEDDPDNLWFTKNNDWDENNQEGDPPQPVMDMDDDPHVAGPEDDDILTLTLRPPTPALDSGTLRLTATVQSVRFFDHTGKEVPLENLVLDLAQPASDSPLEPLAGDRKSPSWSRLSTSPTPSSSNGPTPATALKSPPTASSPPSPTSTSRWTVTVTE